MGFLSNIKLLFREISCIRRFFRIKSGRDIVFYSEDKGSYTYFEGLIDYLTNRAGKEVCYMTSEEKDPVFETGNSRIHPFYVKSLLSLFVGLCDSKVVVMTMPDLDTFHVKRSKYDVKYLYMFHNVGSSFPVMRYGALFAYDTIFCVGPHHIEEIRRQEELYGLRKKALVEFGYCRLEKIHEQYREFLKREKPRRKWKARLLIGPSWGADSIFNTCGAELIKILLDEGYEVVARPHPMTNIHEPRIMENINRRFEGVPNYVYESDISLYESLFSSDVLITDWSGFLYEYTLGTERPALFIDLPRKVVNERSEEVGIEPIEIGLRREIGEVVSPDRLEDVCGAVERLIGGKEKFRDKILKAREKYVYNFGDSSRAGAEYILSYCEEKKEKEKRNE